MSTVDIERFIFSNSFIYLQDFLTAMVFISLCPGEPADWKGAGAIVATFITLLFSPNSKILTHLHESAHTYMARTLGFAATYTINPPVTTIIGQQKAWQASLITLAPLFLVMFGAGIVYAALLLDLPFYIKVISASIGCFAWFAGMPSGYSPNGGLPDWDAAVQNGARIINYGMVVAKILVPICQDPLGYRRA